MPSTYGYTTITILEAYAATDYSGLAPAYTDAQIEGQITAAEELVNTYVGTSFVTTIPDAIKIATKILAYRQMFNRQIDDGVPDMQNKLSFKEGITDDIKEILNDLKSQYSGKRTMWIEERILR